MSSDNSLTDILSKLKLRTRSTKKGNKKSASSTASDSDDNKREQEKEEEISAPDTSEQATKRYLKLLQSQQRAAKHSQQRRHQSHHSSQSESNVASMAYFDANNNAGGGATTIMNGSSAMHAHRAHGQQHAAMTHANPSSSSTTTTTTTTTTHNSQHHPRHNNSGGGSTTTRGHAHSQSHMTSSQAQQAARAHASSSASSTSRSASSSGKSPNGAYSHIDPKQFHSHMTQQDVQSMLKLSAPPTYRTDEKGYIEFQPGLMIRHNFVILDTLGRGTFSKVFESVDIGDKTKCAIKVIRNTHRYIEAAKTELRVLQHITAADDGTSACIHLKEHFQWNQHPCFVFGLYGPSIYTIMSRNRFRAFPDSIVRSLTSQICNAIQFMHHLGIIFTDLKPENMVFVDGRTFPIKLHGKTHMLPLDSRIKIVDFGSAVYEPRYDQNNPKTWKFKDGYNYLIQTRHYRAPEVVLEMPWKRPVDVWSVGCVVLEFLYGSMVFNTHCPIDHLSQMQKMIGRIPRDLIRSASDTKYKELFVHPEGTLRLEEARVSRAQAKALHSYFNMHKLEHRHLYDLVGRCLKWRANERIYGHQLLKHEYFHFIKNILSHTHKFGPLNATGASSSSSLNSSSSSSRTQSKPTSSMSSQHHPPSQQPEPPQQYVYTTQQQQQQQPMQQQAAAAQSQSDDTMMHAYAQ
mmetsp:Transcript_38435/g.62990  ORF Transcript_38435/g.62990 Transcript_38435/m.62990 type:complete len:686 (-) Transcript_38435:526-2583(-)